MLRLKNAVHSPIITLSLKGHYCMCAYKYNIIPKSKHLKWALAAIKTYRDVKRQRLQEA